MPQLKADVESFRLLQQHPLSRLFKHKLMLHVMILPSVSYKAVKLFCSHHLLGELLTMHLSESAAPEDQHVPVKKVCDKLSMFCCGSIKTISIFRIFVIRNGNSLMKELRTSLNSL